MLHIELINGPVCKSCCYKKTAETVPNKNGTKMMFNICIVNNITTQTVNRCKIIDDLMGCCDQFRRKR